MRFGSVRARIRVLLSCAFALAALVSVWHEARPAWNSLDSGYDTFAGYSTLQRQDAAVFSAGLAPDVFDFVGSSLRPGDRFYVQSPSSTYGTLDLHDTVAQVARFYFLPAVEVDDVDNATVVFSYDADPSALHRQFVAQDQVGTDYVSRLSYP